MKRYSLIINICLLLLITLLLTGFLYFLINNDTICINAVGDIRISDSFIKTRTPIISRIRLNGDLIFANFEGVLSEAVVHSRITNPFILTMPYTVPSILRKMGLNCLNLNNNHSLDLGEKQYQETYDYLKQEGFLLSGYHDLGDVIKIKGRTIRVIGFSFNSPNNVNDLWRATEIIKSCKEDIIIVSAHMGGENSKGYIIPDGMEYFGDEERGDVIKFGHTCIDAGADLVLGHSPHILRKIELYKNKLIVYSLGNFIFDYPGVEKNASTPGFSITVFTNKRGDFKKAKIDSFTLKYGIPQSDNRQRAYRFIKDLSRVNNSSHLIFGENGLVTKE